MKTTSGPTKEEPNTQRALVLVGALFVSVALLGWIESGGRLNDVERIKTLAQIVPESPILQTQSAGLALLEGAPLQALELYETVLRRLPDYDLARDGRAKSIIAAAQLGDLDQMNQQRCRGLEQTSLGKKANDEGVRAARAQKVDRAERFWKTALCLDPMLAEANFNLAALFAQRGARQTALDYLRSGLRIQPENVMARSLLEQLNSRPE